ncbi:hypothetical protein CXF72_07425 [Psychromonas sp. MB-3u-54]|uniref:choice-of-anchor H family protein n=1 Tax=Psychromonas sp. MB-3u-54 TaxID=2058319 RepID=UPI000C31CCDD|nr:choice-of-anchor H family protein [Psychromonas sp. MB-3u-54]PKH03297.1 hypothetical protein CXF72_07425 [Psychromonas sp. MB-3u-54]
MNSQLINRIKRKVIINIKGQSLSVKAIFIALVIIFGGQVNADQLKTTQSTVSYGVLSAAINDQMRLDIIDTNYTSVFSDQLIGKATGKSRDEQITFQDSPLIYRSYAPQFTIYNAFTTLQDDFDFDGYYRTFSLVFDADVYSYDGYDSSAAVYAQLYLSKNGGPWINYYRTDDFIIHSDSDQDEYEVITSLASGYNADNYDLLIDLYQVGYDGIVATYSSNDNPALYALPLESGDYDDLYVDTVYVQHGGSFSSWLLIILFLLLAGRVLKPRLKSRDSD